MKTQLIPFAVYAATDATSPWLLINNGGALGYMLLIMGYGLQNQIIKN